MKKSLLFMICCLSTLGAHAQDDDVYFVPSSKNKVEVEAPKSFSSSSYTEWNDDEDDYADWSEGRGNGNWDEDSYNRRGNKNEDDACRSEQRYDKQEKQNKRHKKEKYDNDYDEGYEDGYVDGYFTSRLIRFWSPRIGVYVSSPYYWDYCTYSYYDPWYYTWGPSWSWGWGGWHYWNSWYGWYPYHHHWHHRWYDPWYGYPSYAWGSTHWYPSNAQRGRVGGWLSYGNVRGAGSRLNYGNSTYSNRRTSTSFGQAGRGTTNRRILDGVSTRPSRQFGNRDYNRSSIGTTDRGNTGRPSRSFGNRNKSNNRSYGQPSTTNRKDKNTSTRPSRNFGNTDSRSNRSSRHDYEPNNSNRSSNSFGSPSRSERSSFSTGHSNRSSGFGGGFSGGGRSGGGRSFGGRR